MHIQILCSCISRIFWNFQQCSRGMTSLREVIYLAFQYARPSFPWISAMPQKLHASLARGLTNVSPIQMNRHLRSHLVSLLTGGPGFQYAACIPSRLLSLHFVLQRTMVRQERRMYFRQCRMFKISNLLLRRGKKEKRKQKNEHKMGKSESENHRSVGFVENKRFLMLMFLLCHLGVVFDKQ